MQVSDSAWYAASFGRKVNGDRRVLATHGHKRIDAKQLVFRTGCLLDVGNVRMCDHRDEEDLLVGVPIRIVAMTERICPWSGLAKSVDGVVVGIEDDGTDNVFADLRGYAILVLHGIVNPRVTNEGCSCDLQPSCYLLSIDPTFLSVVVRGRQLPIHGYHLLGAVALCEDSWQRLSMSRRLGCLTHRAA